MRRKTKIIGTIGSLDSMGFQMLPDLVDAGVDCFRINSSHGNSQEWSQKITAIRRLSAERGRHVSILFDLGGIKLRLGEMKNRSVLTQGEEVVITSAPSSSNRKRSPFPRPDILERLEPDRRIYIADGIVCLVVQSVTKKRGEVLVRAKVRHGGAVSSRKGVNIPGVPLTDFILTEADKEAAAFAVKAGVDWLGLSNVRTVEDVRTIRGYLETLGSTALLMAKFENEQGITNLDAILSEVDGAMVARGDMGIEIDMELVPGIQEDILAKAAMQNVVSVVATQILISMVNSPRPRRSEVQDIATAVRDGCDAILLSDEVSVGDYPIETVEVADRTILETEKRHRGKLRLGENTSMQAIAYAASELTDHLNILVERQGVGHSRVRPIVITSGGGSARELARYRGEENILVFGHSEEILQKLALVWGVHPVGVVPPVEGEMVRAVLHQALDAGLVRTEDVVVLLYGDPPGVSGTTNIIRPVQVGYEMDRLEGKQPDIMVKAS